jgi:DNA-binding response OmpR family regulator
MGRRGTSGGEPPASSPTSFDRPSLGFALIVEDDALLSLALEQALRDGGAERVVACASITAAMAELEATPPDILILDVNLADRDDGWTLAELVTSLSPRPPAIVFSTGSPERIPEKIAALGAVMSKPYDPAALVAVLRAQTRKPGLLQRLREALAG